MRMCSRWRVRQQVHETPAPLELARRAAAAAGPLPATSTTRLGSSGWRSGEPAFSSRVTEFLAIAADMKTVMTVSHCHSFIHSLLRRQFVRTVEIVFVNDEAKSTARACIALLILAVSGFACLGELGATAVLTVASDETRF